MVNIKKPVVFSLLTQRENNGPGIIIGKLEAVFCTRRIFLWPIVVIFAAKVSWSVIGSAMQIIELDGDGIPTCSGFTPI